jgi:hypothetical protein
MSGAYMSDPSNHERCSAANIDLDIKLDKTGGRARLSIFTKGATQRANPLKCHHQDGLLAAKTIARGMAKRVAEMVNTVG